MSKITQIIGLFFSLLMTTTAFAGTKTICGSNDDRTPSFNPRVARILKRGAAAGCTVTLIGKSCAVSAGHCSSTFQVAEFNTPASRAGRIVNSRPEDIYEVDKSSIKYSNGGIGNDWAVLRLKQNNITGRFPGELQGHYEITRSFVPKAGDEIRITGYGRDSADPSRNFAQQTHAGPIHKVDARETTISHQADTMGGNSGSSIIHTNTQQVIGIHTHGGCGRSNNSSNSSTLIAGHHKFAAAIKACLDFERRNF
jgi:V8-like Glu-specific endopeptidase